MGNINYFNQPAVPKGIDDSTRWRLSELTGLYSSATLGGWLWVFVLGCFVFTPLNWLLNDFEKAVTSFVIFMLVVLSVSSLFVMAHIWLLVFEVEFARERLKLNKIGSTVPPSIYWKARIKATLTLLLILATPVFIVTFIVTLGFLDSL